LSLLWVLLESRDSRLWLSRRELGGIGDIEVKQREMLSQCMPFASAIERIKRWCASDVWCVGTPLPSDILDPSCCRLPTAV